MAIVIRAKEWTSARLIMTHDGRAGSCGGSHDVYQLAFASALPSTMIDARFGLDEAVTSRPSAKFFR
jgi:hypothetical protein